MLNDDGDTRYTKKEINGDCIIKVKLQCSDNEWAKGLNIERKTERGVRDALAREDEVVFHSNSFSQDKRLPY